MPLAEAFGFAATDANFARNLLGATPTEQVRSSLLAMRSRMSLAITTPSPSRRRDPVTSRNASSSDSGCFASLNSSRPRSVASRWLWSSTAFV